MINQNWWNKLKPFIKKSNAIATRQVSVTFGLYAALWFLYARLAEQSWLWMFPMAFLMGLFTLRFFVLMHDCGHGSLFRTPALNAFFGYALGVITGMPQHVWSNNHAFHHKTNGDWEKYRGPLSTISLEEYNKLTPGQARQYRTLRHPLSFIFIGGFLYVFFNPRFNWIVGVLTLAVQTLKVLATEGPAKAIDYLKICPSKKWKTPKEFRHQSYNNLSLFVIWYFMVQWLGASAFFSVYILALTISGGLGILFFTVQHNFENAYASDTSRVDYVRASLEGTSFLVLPKILNWFTADIAYHHIHHLSTAIPNYNLVACHEASKEDFKNVRRVRLNEIFYSVSCILWDQQNEKIVSLRSV